MKPIGETRLVLVEDEHHEIYRGQIKVGDATLYIYPNSVMIDNIEIDQNYQFQGIGRDVVELLKQMPGISSLTGDSVAEALPFWTKMGAMFDWGELEDLGEEGHHLVGFEISWRLPTKPITTKRSESHVKKD